MPSREEIVKWLRHEKELYRRLAILTTGSAKNIIIDRIDVMVQRIAQVEAMRCETCQWYEPEADEHDWCYHLDCNAWGPDFGCFKWVGSVL